MSQESVPEKSRNKIAVDLIAGAEPETVLVNVIRKNQMARQEHDIASQSTYQGLDTASMLSTENQTVAAQPKRRGAKAKIKAKLKAKKAKPNTQRTRAKWFSGLGAVAVAVVAIVAIGLVGLRLTGFRTFTVMSGSMEPNYPVGSLIYVKPTNYQDLKVGDVISYVANDDKTVITHRISEIEIDKDDASIWRFRTKGDANTATDAKLVHYKNVLGTPIVTIPYLGYIAHNIQQPPGVYIALVVGTLLLAWTFLPGTLEERRKLREKSTI